MILCPRLNEIIQDLTSTQRYAVSDNAPSEFADLNRCAVGGLVVWNGASDATIFGDPAINWAFRALHDRMHLDTGLTFSIEHEKALAGRSMQLFLPYRAYRLDGDRRPNRSLRTNR